MFHNSAYKLCNIQDDAAPGKFLSSGLALSKDCVCWNIEPVTQVMHCYYKTPELSGVDPAKNMRLALLDRHSVDSSSHESHIFHLVFIRHLSWLKQSTSQLKIYVLFLWSTIHGTNQLFLLFRGLYLVQRQPVWLPPMLESSLWSTVDFVKTSQSLTKKEKLQWKEQQ